jgi:hypothetical protein
MTKTQKILSITIPLLLLGGWVLAKSLKNESEKFKIKPVDPTPIPPKKKAEIFIGDLENTGKNLELPDVVYNKSFANLREQPYLSAKVLKNYIISFKL